MLLHVEEANAQRGRKDVIQVTGLVVAGDSAYGVSGVYVYNPAKGRGTVSNYYGYFSMPALEGDTLVLRAAGFRKQLFQIPDSVDYQLSVLIELKADTLILPTVSITPWRTERLFKQAVLSMDMPQEYIYMNDNLSEQVIRRMLYSGATASMNHSYYMQQYVQRQEQSRSYFMPNYTQQFINPFAWATFLQQVKSGGLKDNRPEIDPYELDE